ncbi:MAG TPA: TfoX/Sxy family protein [Solirubrobacteraceae bacterium]|nr:TfoX/Sxy family protein [Solirubrobacteraceae bacterium]
MAYDEELATRVRELLATTPRVSERKMFGGLAFMIAGNMACGIVGTDLMLRLGEAGADAALDEPYVRPMDFTHRPMKTMVYVSPAGTNTPQALRGWIDKALAYASSLPAK